MANNDDHPIRNIPRNKLEIWQEANVRKTLTNLNLEELADNIKRNGIKHPLLVKKDNDKYKIFAGQRRFLASELAGLDYLPCRVYDKITLNNAISLSLSENVFSKQMTSSDKANAVKTLLETYKDKNKICKILGIKKSTLQTHLSYHGLPNEVKGFVDDELINLQLAVKINQKFSKNNATEILRELSSTKKYTIQRKLLQTAISHADKKDTLDDIKKSIRGLSSTEITISIKLQASDLKKMQKIANKHKIPLDVMCSKILIKSINRHYGL